ncbi:hypothetical protein [Pendulispora albinea]|uniref:Uncharacterized protein n=1 Tax=Pendulispora albinea TaxID=2741071 RepID=A0ABZ2LXF2_9BACT
MALDVQKFKAAVCGSVTDLNQDQVRKLLSSRTYGYDFVNGAANAPLSESIILHVLRDGVLRAITLTAPVAIPADGTNFASLIFLRRTAPNYVSLPIANIAILPSASGGTGPLGAFVPYTIPLLNISQQNIRFNAGDLLTLAVAKSGAGVALSAPTSSFHVGLDLEED